MSDVSLTLEKVEKQSLFEIVFCMSWAAVVLYMFIWPVTYNETLMQLIWMPTIVVIVLASLPKRLSYRLMFTISIPSIILIVSIVAQDGSRNLTHCYSAFSYIGMLLLISACVKIRPVKRTFDFIFYSNVFLALLFTVYSFTPIANRVHSHGKIWQSAYFVFDLGNSNLAAMILFPFFCILIINLSYRKYRLPLFILAVYLFYLIYRTNCRSVIFSALLVVFAYIFVGRRKIPKLIVILATLFPTFFAVGYLVLFRHYDGEQIQIMDKSFFSGRQNVYMYYLNLVSNWWQALFGNFADAGLNNAHNIILSVFTSVGLVGLICFYSFYLYIIGDMNRKETTSIRTITIICILAMFVQASAEAACFLGGFPGIMSISSFVLISNYTDYTFRSIEK